MGKDPQQAGEEAVTRRRCRILLVCEAFTGGCRKHIFDIIAAMPATEEFEAVLVYSDLREPVSEEDFPASGNLTAVPMRMLRRVAPLADLVATVKLACIIRRGDFDIIHLHSSKAGMIGRVAALAARSKATVLYTPHALACGMPGLRGVFFHLAEWILSFLPGHFLAVSEGEKEWILGCGLAHRQNIHLVANGIDPVLLRDIPISGSPRTVGVMARLVEQKGVAFFVEAAAIASTRNPQLCFLVAGSGPQRRNLVERASRHGGEIEFEATMRPHEFLSRVDIVVLPSLWEGLPYVLLEAMSAGRAIIASDIPGISDTLADTGILVLPRDPQAMAEAICRLTDNPGEAADFGRTARKRAQFFFSLQRFQEDIIALYRKLLKVSGASEKHL